MGKILSKKDLQYGCFLAGYNCVKCGKTVIVKNFSWGTDKLGFGDTDGISFELDKLMKKKEINYCCKCGSEL
jgi:hypothetical protein